MKFTLDTIFDTEKKEVRIAYIVLASLCLVVSILCIIGILNGKTNKVLDSADRSPVLHGIMDPEGEFAVTEHIINPDSEVRGVWIATVNNINFPSKKGLDALSLKRELDDIVSTCVKNGINAVYFQVRPSGDALYKSEIFPTSEYLTGKQGAPLSGGFDPLEYLVKAAHESNIKVHAWVNPLRVSYGTKANPSHNTDGLAENNPARKNPDYTVAYGDGKLYYNAGIPEVRELIADGVAEIVSGYDVDGVVFDDYFYPYASYTGGVKDKFDDTAAYAEYGAKKPLDEWRRENINTLIKLCYDTVKGTDPECIFGVSPFGIWQNDDGKNGGSDTNGTSAYDELYCDAAAWINGGYVDYIAPQLYWKFDNNAARFDTLVRWWNTLCDSTGVDLYISHGVYRYAEGWDEPENEILRQIEFARSELSYKGSLLYGYDVIKRNVNGIENELAEAFKREIIYTDAISTGSKVAVTSPEAGITLPSYKQTYLLGVSDPAYPLYLDGKKVGRTKSGYFSVIANLSAGNNTFEFAQNGEKYVFSLYNGQKQGGSTTGGAVSHKLMDKLEIIPVSGEKDYFISAGEAISVRVKVPAGATVYAELGDNSVKLISEGTAPGTNKLYEEYYSGKLTMPKAEEGEILDLGNITVKATLKGETESVTLGRVRVGGEGAVIPVEVSTDRTGLKVSPDSYYYDDFTSQTKGMRDNAVSLENGFYRLRVGGYVSESDVIELDERVLIATVSGAEVRNEGAYTRIYIKSDVNIPMNGRVEDGSFILNLYNVDTAAATAPAISDNPLFSSAEYQMSTKQNSFRYHLKLKHPDNFYGFEFSYSDGYAIVSLRNPVKLTNGDKPLENRVIVLDAGHGGYDGGAYGASGENSEAALNLKIVLEAKQKLEELGANVILTRSDDTYVALTDRIVIVEGLSPDLCVSVHQNSMEYNVDVTKVHGSLVLYWEYAGRSLAGTLANSVSTGLGRQNRGASTQKLAMVRCERYPSALVEVGFITNVEELEHITSPDGIGRAAEAIVTGILDYYAMQEEMLLL